MTTSPSLTDSYKERYREINAYRTREEQGDHSPIITRLTQRKVYREIITQIERERSRVTASSILRKTNNSNETNERRPHDMSTRTHYRFR